MGTSNHRPDRGWALAQISCIMYMHVYASEPLDHQKWMVDTYTEMGAYSGEYGTWSHTYVISSRCMSLRGANILLLFCRSVLLSTEHRTSAAAEHSAGLQTGRGRRPHPSGPLPLPAVLRQHLGPADRGERVGQAAGVGGVMTSPSFGYSALRHLPRRRAVLSLWKELSLASTRSS